MVQEVVFKGAYGCFGPLIVREDPLVPQAKQNSSRTRLRCQLHELIEVRECFSDDD